MASAAPSAQDFAKGMQQATANMMEYQENIKSPWVTFGASAATLPALTLPFWPIDVIKNHMMAGKGAALGLKRQFSRKGLGFSLLGASVLGMDVSNRYIQKYGHDFSFTKKVLIGLAPLSILPLASVLESLKINAQISQTPMKQCFNDVIKTAGYRGLFRGFVPYSSLFLLTYCSISLPVYYYQKAKPSGPLEDLEQVQLNPFIVLSSLLLATPIDIIKTRAMLGEKITLQSLKMCPKMFAKVFLIRTAYVMAFGGFLDFFSGFTEGLIYRKKIELYQKNKKAQYFAKDDEFDGFIPENSDEIDSDKEFLKRILMK